MRKLEKNEMKSIHGGHPCDSNPKCTCIIQLLDVGASVDDAFDWCGLLYD